MFQHSSHVSELHLVQFYLAIIHVDIACNHFDLGKYILYDKSESPIPLLVGSFGRPQIKLLIMLALIIIFSLALVVEII